MAKLSQFQMFSGHDARSNKARLRGRDFWRLCESVVALYETNFHADIRMDSAYRVTIYVRDEHSCDHLKELGILAIVDVIGNAEELFVLPDAQKQEQILHWLHSGSMEAAKHFGWPTAPFERARKAVLDARFVNKWVHRHKASRGDRKFRAELHCELNLREFRSELVIFGKKHREIARISDLSKPPDRMIYGWSLGKMKWISKNRVEVRDKRYLSRRVINVESAIKVADKSTEP